MTTRLAPKIHLSTQTAHPPVACTFCGVVSRCDRNNFNIECRVGKAKVGRYTIATYYLHWPRKKGDPCTAAFVRVIRAQELKFEFHGLHDDVYSYINWVLRFEGPQIIFTVPVRKLNQGCNTTMLPNKRLKLHVDTTTTTTTTNTNTTDATACVDISWVCISRFLTVHSLSCLALSSKRMTKLFAEELKLRKRKLLLEQVLKLEGVMRYRVGRFLTAHSMTQLTRSSRGLAMIFCWPRNRRLYRERLFRRHSAKHAWKVVRSSGMLSIDSERRLAETSGFILRRWGPKPPQGRWARWS